MTRPVRANTGNTFRRPRSRYSRRCSVKRTRHWRTVARRSRSAIPSSFCFPWGGRTPKRCAPTPSIGRCCRRSGCRELLMAGDQLPSQRHLFDIPESVSYLNCAYMSPLLRSVIEAGQRAVARKAHPWAITPADFFSEVEHARHLFATLLDGGATADDVAIVPAASYGMAVACANVSLARGQMVLLLDEEF